MSEEKITDNMHVQVERQHRRLSELLEQARKADGAIDDARDERSEIVKLYDEIQYLEVGRLDATFTVCYRGRSNELVVNHTLDGHDEPIGSVSIVTDYEEPEVILAYRVGDDFFDDPEAAVKELVRRLLPWPAPIGNDGGW